VLQRLTEPMDERVSRLMQLAIDSNLHEALRDT
jgi:hypothetical protein